MDPFAANKEIGQQQLISWLDRLLNTIDVKGGDGKRLYRPCCINYYPHTLLLVSKTNRV